MHVQLAWSGHQYCKFLDKDQYYGTELEIASIVRPASVNHNR